MRVQGSVTWEVYREDFYHVAECWDVGGNSPRAVVVAHTRLGLWWAMRREQRWWV